jgi:predicted DNA-binding transcriptional regulator YafY
MEETVEGMQFRITVVLNLELERELLGFGEGVRVLSPARLVRRLRNRILKMAELYPPDEV